MLQIKACAALGRQSYFKNYDFAIYSIYSFAILLNKCFKNLDDNKVNIF